MHCIYFYRSSPHALRASTRPLLLLFAQAALSDCMLLLRAVHLARAAPSALTRHLWVPSRAHLVLAVTTLQQQAPPVARLALQGGGNFLLSSVVIFFLLFNSLFMLVRNY